MSSQLPNGATLLALIGALLACGSPHSSGQAAAPPLMTHSPEPARFTRELATFSGEEFSPPLDLSVRDDPDTALSSLQVTIRWHRTDGEPGLVQSVQYLNPLPISLQATSPVPDVFIALSRIPETNTIAALVAARIRTYSDPRNALVGDQRVGVAWTVQHWELSWDPETSRYTIAQKRAPDAPSDSGLFLDRDGVDPAELVAVHLDATTIEYAIGFEANVPAQPEVHSAIATMRFNRESRELTRSLELVPEPPPADPPPSDPE